MGEIKSIKLNKRNVTNVKPYYLGLDIGTNSIGYAITDKNYNIIQKGKKSLWGVRLFETAKTAAGRRGFRSARRNKNRRKQRIKLLQEYFSEEISKIDPSFYLRLKESFYYQEDKSINQKNTLFNDKNYTDTDYHKEYPTIYHLRHELMTSDEYHDIRLVYLALAHIMKHRGNFLMEGKSLNSENQLDFALNQFEEEFEKYYDENLIANDEKDDLVSILVNKRTTTNDKIKELKTLINNSKNNSEFLKLIVGNSVNLDKLFNDESLKDLEINKVKFSDSNSDEKLESLENILDERFGLLKTAYDVYNAIILHNLLSNSQGEKYDSISLARISIYDKHANDLKDLKKFVRLYDEKFKEKQSLHYRTFVLNDKLVKNYVSYSGHVDTKDDKSPLGIASHSEFLAYIKPFIKKLLDTLDENTEDYKFINNISNDIELNVFLPKISSTANGVIPYQIHLNELKLILEKSSKHHKFLTDKIKDEIEQIFTFKIPYYVGPLNSKSSKSWLVRKSFENIKPWNFKDIVDFEKTEEKFIRNMTNKCTYLVGEDVLPKESLIYSEFMVRNALNILTIDGNRLDFETNDYLFNDLFVNRSSTGRITKSRIVSSLKKNGIVTTVNNLGGIDEEIPHKLKSLHDFNNILTNKELSNSEIEEIIERITIFSEGGSTLPRWLETRFGEKLSKQQINKISKLKYAGWGRLSKKFLSGIKYTLPNMQKLSILDVLRNEQLNLMEILNDKEKPFIKLIEEHNKEFIKSDFEVSEEDLDNMYISPAVKKAIRQVLHLINELMGIMKGSPERLFLELAREEGEKTKSKSRKKILDELYFGIRNSINEFDALTKNNFKSANESWIKNKDILQEDNLKSKRLYLYYRQWGRCMYSGEAIDLNNLMNSSMYDIDHIYPRSLTKDDSFNNIVLVKSELNRDKTDDYPIDKDIQDKMINLWSALHHGGFISTEKFNRLRDINPLSSNQLEGFINRQLVETRQSTKAISTLFNNLLTETEIVYVKAGHVSDFRYRDGMRDKAYTKFYFPKVRDINDYHHAKDAYLNIVVGNAYHSMFTKKFFLKNKDLKYKYNLVKFYDREIKDGDRVVWYPGEFGTIATVNKMMQRNNVLISIEAYKQRGEFFKLQLVKKGLGQYPIKSKIEKLKNTKKYGAYNSVKGSHFCLLKHSIKGKDQFVLENIPILINVKNDRDLVQEYFIEKGYKDPIIIKDKILYKSMIEIDGKRMIILNKTNNSFTYSIPYQMVYSKEVEDYLKYLERIKTKGLEPQNFNTDQLQSVFDEITYRMRLKPFKNYYINVSRKIDELSNGFSDLSILKRIDLIFSLVRLLNGKGNSVDLSDLYLVSTGVSKGSRTGVTTEKTKIDSTAIVKLVTKSISGFFENVTVMNL